MLNKSILGWSLYDLANTAFSALIITIFFPVLIKELGGNELQIGLIMGLALLFSAIFVPFIGGLSDALKIKKPFIILFTLITVIFTIFIAFSPLILALIFGLIAILFYHASLDIYDSILPDLVDSKNKLGKVSGIGTAFGYVGTILSLGMATYILNQFGWDSIISTKLMFPATGIFFFIFSLPLFYWLKDSKGKNIRLGKGIKKSFMEIKSTITNIKKYRNVWMFMLASLLYIDSLNTVIIFLYLFGNEQIGLTLKQFFPIYLAMAVTAILGSLFFGYLSDKIGPKKSLLSALGSWIVVVLILIIHSNLITFIVAGLLGGALLGAIWTTTRPLLTQIAPKHKLAELFGFQGLTEKVGGVFGPFIFGVLVFYFSYTAALVFILITFVAGMILLAKVRI